MNGHDYHCTKCLSLYVKHTQTLCASIDLSIFFRVGVLVCITLRIVFFQGYEGVRESLNSKKKISVLTVKSVDSNMNKKNKKKKEEEIELPSKKKQESLLLHIININ